MQTAEPGAGHAKAQVMVAGGTVSIWDPKAFGILASAGNGSLGEHRSFWYVCV